MSFKKMGAKADKKINKVKKSVKARKANGKAAFAAGRNPIKSAFGKSAIELVGGKGKAQRKTLLGRAGTATRKMSAAQKAALKKAQAVSARMRRK